MATVTYRGVEYDTEEYNAKVVDEAAKRERHELMYRGLKVKSKASPCSQTIQNKHKNVYEYILVGISFC